MAVKDYYKNKVMVGTIISLLQISMTAYSFITTIQNKTNKHIRLDFLVRYFDNTYSKEKINNLQLEIPPYCYIEDITELVQKALNELNNKLNEKNFNNAKTSGFILLENIDNNITVKSACLASRISSYKFYEKYGLLVITEHDLPIIDGFVKV
jgi:hypothetical protein